MYEEIDKETHELLLETLIKRTIEGKQHWNELDYKPIGFISTSDNQNQVATVSHMFELKTEFNGRNYELELTEGISFPSRKGDISGSLYYEDESGPTKYDFSLSFDLDTYDECSAEELMNTYKDSVIVKLADVVVQVFENTEAVKFGFSYARFFNETGICSKLKKDPLVKLCEKLMEEERFVDFHKIILDTHYRDELQSEI